MNRSESTNKSIQNSERLTDIKQIDDFAKPQGVCHIRFQGNSWKAFFLDPKSESIPGRKVSKKLVDQLMALGRLKEIPGGHYRYIKQKGSLRGVGSGQILMQFDIM